MSPATPRTYLLSLYLLAIPLSCVQAEQTWTEVRSPHFRVITDGSSSDGRKVANEFEQMRHVFALRFSDEHIESGAPLTIVAARDSDYLQAARSCELEGLEGQYRGGVRSRLGDAVCHGAP